MNDSRVAGTSSSHYASKTPPASERSEVWSGGRIPSNEVQSEVVGKWATDALKPLERSST